MSMPSGGPLVLANHADFTGQNIDARFGPNEVKIWYDGSASLADHALFWAEGDALVIVPEDLHPGLLEDVRCFFGTEALDVLRASGGGASLCDRVDQDQEVGQRVRRHLRQADKPEILAWGLTPALATFLRRRADEGLDLQTPGIPSPDALWLVQLLDSKPGFRLLAEELSRKHQQVRVPEGLILPDLDAAIAAAEDHFFRAGHSVVIKAARGTGGYSTLVATRSEQPQEQATVLRRVRALARFDTFWEVGSVVVERFVSGGDGAVPTAFTVDACVSEDGTVSVDCLGRMLIEAGKRYDGAVVGKDAVESGLAVQLREVAAIFGRALAERGFTGLFDLDLVVDEDGIAWVCEMNVRRASPSHLLAIARRAFGHSWATSGAALGRDYVKLQGSLNLVYDDLRGMVKDFRRRNPSTLDLLITQASCSLQRRSPGFGYAILAEDAQTCALEADRFERFVYSSLGLSPGTLNARLSS